MNRNVVARSTAPNIVMSFFFFFTPPKISKPSNKNKITKNKIYINTPVLDKSLIFVYLERKSKRFHRLLTGACEFIKLGLGLINLAFHSFYLFIQSHM